MSSAIVEWAEASEAERAVGLCNAGRAVRPGRRSRALAGGVRNDNAKGEYYLTDVVALAVAEGRRVAAVEAPMTELRGVNSRAELAEAEAAVQARLRQAAMAGGVDMTAPDTVFLARRHRVRRRRHDRAERRVRPRRDGASRRAKSAPSATSKAARGRRGRHHRPLCAAAARRRGRRRGACRQFRRAEGARRSATAPRPTT